MPVCTAVYDLKCLSVQQEMILNASIYCSVEYCEIYYRYAYILNFQLLCKRYQWQYYIIIIF